MGVRSPFVVTSALFGTRESECKSDARPCRYPELLLEHDEQNRLISTAFDRAAIL